MTIAQMARNWAAIKVTDEAIEIIGENTSEIVQLQQMQLYDRGTDGSNNELPDYSPQSISSGYVSKKSNPRLGSNGPYDLKNTGDFYNQMAIELSGDSFAITSSDEKAPILINKLGSGILNLDSISKNSLKSNILQPYLILKIAIKTGCGIS